MIRHTRVGKAHAAKNRKAVSKNRRAAARHGPAAHTLRYKGYGVSFRAGDAAVAQPRRPLDRQAGALPCGKALREVERKGVFRRARAGDERIVRGVDALAVSKHRCEREKLHTGGKHAAYRPALAGAQRERGAEMQRFARHGAARRFPLPDIRPHPGVGFPRGQSAQRQQHGKHTYGETYDPALHALPSLPHGKAREMFFRVRA